MYFVKDSFMTLWANILEVIIENMMIFFVLISYGKKSLVDSNHKPNLRQQGQSDFRILSIR